MSNPWQAVPEAPGIFRAQYKVPGTSPFSTLVDLGSDSYLIFSPGPGLENSLPDFVTANSKLLLLAPCVGHTLGISGWSAAHTNAELFAPDAIHEKITKNCGVDELQSVGALAAQMPDHVQIHVPPQNKFHEVWLSVKQSETTFWVIGDAFLHFETVDGNYIKKFLLGLYGIKPGLRLHKLFRLGLTDKQKFKEWAVTLFDSTDKQVLLPCHREIYDAKDCGEKLKQIINAMV
ncbi:MAG: hypothetical protein ISP88_03805 [Pseudomonadales bacterium]|nr:hypothetical protein [Pseudomonadales bacterium]MBL6815683.1 hypothetical protein [Pseudomonadales bacterium]